MYLSRKVIDITYRHNLLSRHLADPRLLEKLEPYTAADMRSLDLSEHLLHRLACWKNDIYQHMGPSHVFPGPCTRLSLSGLLHPLYVRYALRIRELINPEHAPLITLYGGAGADISTALLATDSTDLFFIQRSKGAYACSFTLSPQDFSDLNRRKYDYHHSYLEKFFVGYAPYPSIAQKNTYLGALAFELSALGVDLASVQTGTRVGAPALCFDWTYPKTEVRRRYTITFIDADVDDPGSYPLLFRDFLATEGFDIYYQRAGMAIPQEYGPDCFLTYLQEHIHPEGAFVTDDIAFSDGTYDMTPAFPKPLIWPVHADPALAQLNELILGLHKRNFAGDENDIYFSYGWRLNVRKRES